MDGFVLLHRPQVNGLLDVALDALKLSVCGDTGFLKEMRHNGSIPNSSFTGWTVLSFIFHYQMSSRFAMRIFKSFVFYVCLGSGLQPPKLQFSLQEERFWPRLNQFGIYSGLACGSLHFIWVQKHLRIWKDAAWAFKIIVL